MRVGDLVRFKPHDNQPDWLIGLLIRYDKFIKIAEIESNGQIHYAPARLVQTHQRGRK